MGFLKLLKDGAGVDVRPKALNGGGKLIARPSSLRREVRGARVQGSAMTGRWATHRPKLLGPCQDIRGAQEDILVHVRASKDGCDCSSSHVRFCKRLRIARQYQRPRCACDDGEEAAKAALARQLLQQLGKCSDAGTRWAVELPEIWGDQVQQVCGDGLAGTRGQQQCQSFRQGHRPKCREGQRGPHCIPTIHDGAQGTEMRHQVVQPGDPTVAPKRDRLECHLRKPHCFDHLGPCQVPPLRPSHHHVDIEQAQMCMERGGFRPARPWQPQRLGPVALRPPRLRDERTVDLVGSNEGLRVQSVEQSDKSRGLGRLRNGE